MKRAILVCCLSVKWPGLITVHYSSARCHNKPSGSLAVALSLSSLKKQRCSVLLAVSSGQLPILKPHGNQRGLDSSVILNPASEILHLILIKCEQTKLHGSSSGLLKYRLWSTLHIIMAV